jgi:hypothetical protein
MFEYFDQMKVQNPYGGYEMSAREYYRRFYNAIKPKN